MPWTCRHPSEIPRSEWLDHLNVTTDPSPYLLPEWPAFWETVWPNTHAEFWSADVSGGRSVSLLALRKRRGWFNWVFAQPFGTPGGWIGPEFSATESAITVDALLEQMVDRFTLQVTLTLPHPPEAQPQWVCAVDPSCAWIIDLRNARTDDPLAQVSTSHKRNIDKGARLGGTIDRIVSAVEVQDLLVTWTGRATHDSRIVLHRKHGPAMAAVFGRSDALRWWVLRIGERPVATSLWLVLRDRAVFVDGAMDRDPDIAGANHYMFAHALREMYDAGARIFDLGSGPLGQSSEGLDWFKEGWGAQEVPRTEFVMRRPWYHRLRHLL